MSVKAPFSVPVDRIAAFARSRGIGELALFGSVLRDDFRPDSDVDVLGSFLPDVQPTLADLDRMTQELRDLFGRPVDLVERRPWKRARITSAGSRSSLRRRSCMPRDPAVPLDSACLF